MARPVPLGLFPEGPTDIRFLAPLLRRLVVDLCASTQVDIPDEVIDLGQGMSGLGRRDFQVREAVRLNASGLAIVFIHADGAGSPDQKRAEQCIPGIQRIREDYAARIRGVPVVPVREMEAWALTDGDAVRAATGSRLDDVALGLPERPALAENVTDPKQRLREVFERARPKSSRRTPDRWEGYLSLLGEQVRLPRLRELTAFQQVESDLRGALVDLGVLN